MARLQHDIIPEKEITLARNYLLGKFLGRTDGPFNQIEVFKSYFVENLAINKFEAFVEKTNEVKKYFCIQKKIQEFQRRSSKMIYHYSL